MELVLNYALYVIVGIGVLIPITGLGIAPALVVKSLLAVFPANYFSQLIKREKFTKFLEKNKNSFYGRALAEFALQADAKAGVPGDLKQSLENEKHHSHGGHHVISIATYTLVFLGLILGTIITVWVSMFDFGSMNMVIAMAVATAKASLVLGFFMHLKYDNMLNRVIFLSGFFFLFLLFSFSVMDIYTRVKVFM